MIKEDMDVLMFFSCQNAKIMEFPVCAVYPALSLLAGRL